MRKRLLGLILTLTLAFNFAACGQERVTEEPKEDSQEVSKGAVEEEPEEGAVEEEPEEVSVSEMINDETATYKGVCGDETKWYYKDNILVIRGNGLVETPEWHYPEYANLDIKWVIVEEGVTSLCNNCFTAYPGGCDEQVVAPNCNNLSKVELPSTLTSIEEYSFAYNKVLEEIILPDGVLEIGLSAFEGCGLKKIILPDELFILGDRAFASCESLEEITIPRGVKTLSGTCFGYCSNLKKVTLPDNITVNPCAFIDCKSLEIININKTMEVYDCTFYGCEKMSKESKNGFVK